MNTVYYECEICGEHHPINWNGDCRDDDNRYTEQEIEDKHLGDYHILPMPEADDDESMGVWLEIAALNDAPLWYDDLANNPGWTWGDLNTDDHADGNFDSRAEAARDWILNHLESLI